MEGKGQFILRCLCTTGLVCQKLFRDAPVELKNKSIIYTYVYVCVCVCMFVFVYD